MWDTKGRGLIRQYGPLLEPGPVLQIIWYKFVAPGSQETVLGHTGTWSLNSGAHFADPQLVSR
jgi:hypothetical protein